jgi:hypothetical protein
MDCLFCFKFLQQTHLITINYKTFSFSLLPFDIPICLNLKKKNL